ncbi:MAG: GNAT family N-acetyltransferase [Firmicutes bacterium]|nr:GNAT family N-acetyltransferase [Bacillota bacterium]
MAVAALKTTPLAGLMVNEITDARNRDFIQCAALLQKAFELSSEEIHDLALKINQGIPAPDEVHLLAVKQGDLVVGCVVFYYLGHVHFGFMELITTRAEHRNQGIGSYLYKAMISYLQERIPQLKGMVLEVQNWPLNMEKRKAFFLRQGAIPLDLGFYPLPAVIKDSGLIFMVHPLKLNFKMDFDTISSLLKNMSSAI